MSEAVLKKLKKYNVVLTMKPIRFTVLNFSKPTKEMILEILMEKLRTKELDELFIETVEEASS